MDAEDRKKMDSIAERLAENGGISRASAHRLLQQVFFQEDISDRFVRTEAGMVALGLTVFTPAKVVIPDQLPDFYRNLDRFPPDQPRPTPRTPENRELLEAASRRMEFRVAPVMDRPNHYRWVVSVAEDEAPEILRVWNQYCSHVSMLESWQQILEEEPDPYRSAEEEEEETPGVKPWPKESVRDFIRDAGVKAIQSRRVWNRERRKYWPVRLVVNNTVGEDTDKAG